MAIFAGKKLSRFRQKISHLGGNSKSHSEPGVLKANRENCDAAAAEENDDKKKTMLKLKSLIAGIEDTCTQGPQHYLQMLLATADANDSSESESDSDDSEPEKEAAASNQLQSQESETVIASGDPDVQHFVHSGKDTGSPDDVIASAAGLNSSVNDKTVATTLANVSLTNWPEDLVRKTLQIPDNEVIDKQMPAWFVRDVMIQGQLYSTSEALYFLAHLPLPSSTIIKEGTLRRFSATSMRITRSWYVLRQNSFAYFGSAAEKYVPLGSINLSLAKYAAIDTTSSGKPLASFTIVMPEGSLTLKADSAGSAHEWAKSIQKEIFRQRNQGDEVKLRLPWPAISQETFREAMFNTVAMHLAVFQNTEERMLTDYLFVFFFREASEAKQLDYFTECIDNRGSRGAVIYTDDNDVVMDVSKIKQTSPLRDSTYTDGFYYQKVSTELTGTFVVPTGLSYQSDGKSPREVEDALFEHILTTDRPKPTNLLENDKVKSGDKTYTVIRRSGPASDAALANETDSGIFHTLTEKIKDIPVDLREHAEDIHEKIGTTLPDPQAVVDSVRQQVKEEVNRIRHSKHPDHERIYNESGIAATTSFSSRQSNESESPTEVNLIEPTVDLDKDELEDINGRYRGYFALGSSVYLVATFLVHLSINGKTHYGKCHISNQYLTFRRLGINVKDMRLLMPFEDILDVTTKTHKRSHREFARIAIRGHSPIMVRFKCHRVRDNFINVVRNVKLEWSKAKCSHSGQKVSEEHLTELSMQNIRAATYEEMLSSFTDIAVPPILLDPLARGRNETFLIQPLETLRITMLTIGSRGDVQPYIALAKGLMKEGHQCKIATHEEFREAVEKEGISFAPVAGNPDELMKIMIEHGSFSVSFLRDAYQKFKTWIEELLDSAWDACQDSDLLIESPSAMAGLHIAEALRIPYFRAFTMPWTRTKQYPHAFLVSDQKLGSSYNYMSYVMFDNMLWTGISSRVNSWRRRKLGLKKTSLEDMHQQQVPFLYNVSPAVLTPTLDAPDWVHTTGYWFVEPSDDYEPDAKLVEFIKKAKDEKKKIVYIGFGSIIVPDPAEMTRAVIEGVEEAGVYCVLAKGWSCHGSKDKDDEDKPETEEAKKDDESSAEKEEKQKADDEIKLPDCIFQVDSIPHDWLFPQVDAAVHHGGSGTTGASLRQGLPTVIKPFFGDQFFYARRIADIGCGVNLSKLTGSSLAKALKTATRDEKMISKAAAIGEQIKHENGVTEAIFAIYRELSYARSLIKGPVSVSPSRAAKITAHAEAMTSEKHHFQTEASHKLTSSSTPTSDSSTGPKAASCNIEKPLDLTTEGARRRDPTNEETAGDAIPSSIPTSPASTVAKSLWPLGRFRHSEAKAT